MATILIVDDLSANRAFLVTLLRGQGHRLLEAANGSLGLAAVKAEVPDLVITDVLMPVMDGYEFLRRLRLDPATSRIPVLFYTAPYGEREARAVARSSGASYVLRKPAEPAEVLEIIGHVLAGRPEPWASPGGVAAGAEDDYEQLQLLTDRLSESTADLRVANARLRAVINIGLELTSRSYSDRLLQSVCAAACDLFGATYATLGIIDPKDRTVRRFVTAGTEAGHWIKPGDAPGGILGKVVDKRRTIRGDNPGGNPATLNLPAGHPEIQAFLAAPVASPAQVYGWFCLVGNEGGSFTVDDEDLVTALAGQIGRIHENGSLTEAARQRTGELEHEFGERRQAEHALRQSERLIRNLVEHLPHRILIKDRQSVMLFCNANYAADVGLPPEEVIGKDAFAFYPRELAEAYNADDRAVMASGTMKSVDEPYQVGGEERWVHTVKMPYCDEQGRVVGILVVFEDITEHKRLDEQFRQSQKLEGLGQLAGGVAHDFNNLLTVILGCCDLLSGRLSPSDPLLEDVEEIRKCGDRAATLTRQLLAFSRKQVLDVRVLDLNRLLEGFDGLLQRLIGAEIDLRTVLAPDLGMVKVDPGQVEQIVMNLVLNARDAMPAGGKLTLETSNVHLDEGYGRRHIAISPGPYVMLAVTDSGAGMDSATKARVFEPFFTTKEQGKGTGLGLSTVYGIVKQSGGFIWCYSELDEGTTFKIYLPRVEEAVEPAAPAPVVPVTGGSETILVAEDETQVRRLVEQLLTLSGYTVITTANGAEALRECQDFLRPLDLLITDVVMPGMSRNEFMARLGEIRPGMKVLFMSGYAGDAVLRHGKLGDGSAFLQKPLTRDALNRKVREILDR